MKVSGCVCTTGVGKPSSETALVSCYTNRSSQEELATHFEYAASHFDEIIIDDFYFTDCEVANCNINATFLSKITFFRSVFFILSAFSIESF